MVTVATERERRARAAKGRTHSGKPAANASRFGDIATFVLNNVNRIVTVPVTDELSAYRWIGRKFPAHLHVNHTKGEYVRRDPLAAATVHVNTAESFNATLKRAWVGVFHWFSIKHTDRYLHETSFRWNARLKDTDARLADPAANPPGFREFTRSTGRLRWRDLTA